jgi:hypothetical protein
MKVKSKLQCTTMIALVMGFFIFGAQLAMAQSTPGNWVLYPPQESSYTTLVQEPIKADGSSNFKSTGKSVIPIKFKLSTSPGPVILQSILSDGSDSNSDTTNDYSFLSFTPASPLSFNDITSLIASYTFTEGNCHGGALRWSVRLQTGSVFIYYGEYPNFTNCTGFNPANNQSGLNMIGQSDLRYDLSQVGGSFYGSYVQAQALVGNLPVIRVSLVLDGGWAGDQVINPLGNVSVNGNAFVPENGTPTETCDLPPAEIQITKVLGAPEGPVNEPISIQPGKDDSDFRIVDCKYMYNLATSSLSGPGRYKVETVIDGIPVGGAAFFDLR